MYYSGQNSIAKKNWIKRLYPHLLKENHASELLGSISHCLFCRRDWIIKETGFLTGEGRQDDLEIWAAAQGKEARMDFHNGRHENTG